MATAHQSSPQTLASPTIAPVSGPVLGESPLTRQLQQQIATIAPRATTVLIHGETGAGKEMAARSIHALSPRADRPFVPVDCTAFSSELIESQLFGHVKGAFTGAVGDTLGMLRCAHGGTLFLDEIGELPLGVQAKLLRCVQERTVVPVGGVAPIAIDVRIIAATHRDLSEMVAAGTFRQDLYYRINVVRLTIEPLRRRREDVLRLAAHFLDELARLYDEPGKCLSLPAQQALLRYDWPGNVRELRNTMERAFVFCTGRTIDLEHLPSEVGETNVAECESDPLADDVVMPLAEAERALVARALRSASGNQSEAARVLHVERHRMRRLVTRHGLEHLLA